MLEEKDPTEENLEIFEFLAEREDLGVFVNIEFHDEEPGERAEEGVIW